MVLGNPPHSQLYLSSVRSLVLVPLPFTPLTLIPLYYVQYRHWHSSIAALPVGSLAALPGRFACVSAPGCVVHVVLYLKIIILFFTGPPLVELYTGAGTGTRVPSTVR